MNKREDNLRFNRIKDIIDLIMTMQSLRYGISIKEIQEKYNVSRRTAIRMKDVVLALCPSITEIETHTRIKRWGFKGKSINLFSFNSDDIADLENIKELCRINHLENKIDLLKKIITSIKSANNTNLSSLENDVEILLENEGFLIRQGSSYKVSAEILTIIRSALKSMKKVQFNYQSADYERDKETNFRIIKGLKSVKEVTAIPLGILYGEKHYLIAKNDSKIKNYLLHKITDIKVLDEYFEPDSSFNLKEYAEQSVGIYHDKILNIKLKFKKEIADDVTNYIFHPSQKIEIQKNGAVIVTFQLSGEKSILYNLFKWGENVQVISPKSLKDNYKNYLSDILKNI